MNGTCVEKKQTKTTKSAREPVFITIFFCFYFICSLNQPSRNSSCGFTLMLNFIQINIRLVMHSKPQQFITLLLLKTCKRGQKAQGVTLMRSLSEANYCTRAVQWNSQTWRNVMIQHLVPSELLASMLGRKTLHSFTFSVSTGSPHV